MNPETLLYKVYRTQIRSNHAILLTGFCARCDNNGNVKLGIVPAKQNNLSLEEIAASAA